MAALHLAVKHIVNNFALYGFGTEESAVLQAVKELLENSIDACKARHKVERNMTGTVSVLITSTEPVSNCIMLDVTDDGCGIETPTQLLKCFSTQKDADQVRTTGRYGVGLSTCLIYSLANTAMPLRLITKCPGDSSATVADFSVNRAGEPTCVQSKSVEWKGLNCGTKIRLALPLSSGDHAGVLRRVFGFISAYMMQLSCQPSLLASIDLSVKCGAVHLTAHSAASDPHLVSTARLSETVFSSHFKHRLEGQLGAGWTCVGAGAGVVDGSAVEVAVQACLLALAHAPDQQPSADGSPQNHDSPSQAPPLSATLPVQLWRFVNSVPLLSCGDQALDCACTAAVRAVRWADLGLKLRLCTEPAGLPPLLRQDPSATAGTHTQPSWELLAQRPELACTLEERQLQLLLAVDVRAAHAPFANMRKTALTNGDGVLTKLIAGGVGAALSRLEAADDAPGVFIPKRDYKMRLVEHKYLPSIARSVTQIVRHSQDVDYMRWAQQVLGLPPMARSADAYDQEAVQRAILLKLRDIVSRGTITG